MIGGLMQRLFVVLGLVLALGGCRLRLERIEEEQEARIASLVEECGSRTWSYEETTYYVDRDRDGFGGMEPTISFTSHCDHSDTHAVKTGDCDDENGAVFPRALEFCDGIDNNCVDGVDEPNGNDGAFMVYRDDDLDGYGGGAQTLRSCDGEAREVAYRWFVPDAGDCDDTNGLVSPGALEVCDGIDNDCDEVTDLDASDLRTYFEDLDGDGFGSLEVVLSCEQGVLAENSNDCDDSNDDVFPGALEVCDGVDNDCDLAVDADDEDTLGFNRYYPDLDGDGYGDGDADPVIGCTSVPGHVLDGSDCNDDSFQVNPQEFDYCDGVDNNCSGDESDAIGRTTYYRDNDGDGAGDPSASVATCDQPSGYVETAGDCHDGRPDVYPGALETCNGTDNNCQGGETDATDPLLWYADSDADQYGNTGVTTRACFRPTGYTAVAGDCDDGLASVNPSAEERCNGFDDDCDTLVDDFDTAPSGRTTWYVDGDGDAFGGSTTRLACSRPSGYVSVGGDCNDAVASIYPGAVETCNGFDDDCDTQIDEGLLVAYYTDVDRDTYGVGTAMSACTIPPGFASRAGDCDDTRSTRYPGAPELCDGLDNDCDSSIDEGAQSVTWYRDQDADTWGTSTQSLASCTVPPGYVQRAGDCNDTVAAIRPGADEICDGVDNDCDLLVDDADSVTGATRWYADHDVDGVGGAASVTRCVEPASGDYALETGDCDDDDPSVYPGAVEVCNDSADNDCDTLVDALDTDAGCLVVWCELVDDPVFPLRVYARGVVRPWLTPALVHPTSGATLEVGELRASGGTVNGTPWLGETAVHVISRNPLNGPFQFTVASKPYDGGQVRFARVLRDGIALDPVENEACVLDLANPQVGELYLSVP